MGGRTAVVVLVVAFAAVALLKARGPERGPSPPTDVELSTARVSIGRYCLAKDAGRPAPLTRREMRDAAEMILLAASESPDAMIGDQRRRDLLADTAESFAAGCDPQLGPRLERTARRLRGN